MHSSHRIVFLIVHALSLSLSLSLSPTGKPSYVAPSLNVFRPLSRIKSLSHSQLLWLPPTSYLKCIGVES